MSTKPEGPAQEPQLAHECPICCADFIAQGKALAGDLCPSCSLRGPYPATPAPSQPAGAREWAESHIGDVILIAGTKLDGLKFMLWEPTRWVLLHDVLTLYLAQQTAAKDAELAKWRDEAALRNAGEEAAERERDSLREELERTRVDLRA